MHTTTPKIIIAGTHSGAGKTSVSLAIMAGLTQTGHKVQAYKVGPDYIDPGYHRIATGNPSHNLDSWILGHETVQWLFEKTSQNYDIAVIEGVMGLYDGFSSTQDDGSTAEIAKLLKAPVILVVDAKSMVRSVSAIIKGYQDLDPDINICGIILNRAASEHHATILKESIEFYNKIPVFGVVLKNEKITIPERHLGLKTASENTELKTCLESLLKNTKTNNNETLGIHLENILKCANDHSKNLDQIDSTKLEHLKYLKTQEKNPYKTKTRIAYAKDKAFQFYYQANLDYLKACGAELIPFSPLEDAYLPEDIGGLYFGGGFPEMHAQQIEENKSLRHAIKEAIAAGIPTYAECGGLIYLTEGIIDLDGHFTEMLNVIPGKITMTKRLQNFGYCENTTLKDTFLDKKGETFRGHEFHYSQWEMEGITPCHSVEKKRRRQIRNEGYASNNIVATYIHCHFLSYPQRALNFLASAHNWLKTQTEGVC